MDWDPPCFPVLHYLPEIAQTHVHWITYAIQPSHPLLLPFFLPSVFHSIRVFSSESALHVRWPKCWSYNFNTSPFNTYSELISFSIDWFDLAVQGTLKSLLQHHSSKAVILWCSTFFMVQLSHPYLATGNTIALTVWIFASKVMSLFFNMLPSFFIAFLPSSLLVSWLWAPSAVFRSPGEENLSLFPLFLHLFAGKWWDSMPWS